MPARLRVAPEWLPPRDPATGALVASGHLWEFTEKIASSRREGKNRRDGATVSTRVLRLTDLLGRRLFEAASSPEGMKGSRLSAAEAARVRTLVKEERRRRTMEGRAQL